MTERIDYKTYTEDPTVLKMLVKGWKINNPENREEYGYGSRDSLPFDKFGFWLDKKLAEAKKVVSDLFCPNLVSCYVRELNDEKCLDVYHAKFDLSYIQEAVMLLRPTGKRSRSVDENEKPILYISPNKDYPCMVMNKYGAIIIAPRVE